jgi:hypothetical protein
MDSAKPMTETWPGRFCSIGAETMATTILKAQSFVGYAAPGVSEDVGGALLEIAAKTRVDVRIVLDFCEETLRMGYGDLVAVERLCEVLTVETMPGLRCGFLIVDDSAWVYTPTPMYLERDRLELEANALKLSSSDVRSLKGQMFPVQAELNVDGHALGQETAPSIVNRASIDETRFAEVTESIAEAPPVDFDVARQVRVYEPYFQYVELSLKGAAIQRRRIAIPKKLQQLGGADEIVERLKTTFDLVERGNSTDSRELEKKLKDLRESATKSLGVGRGRVVLKVHKDRLRSRVADLRLKLGELQVELRKDLQKRLDQSRAQIVDYYAPRVAEDTPEDLKSQILTDRPSPEVARKWVDQVLGDVFPSANDLIDDMRLEEHYKDVTYETLCADWFLDAVRSAFPMIDWERPHREFLAASQKENEGE